MVALRDVTSRSRCGQGSVEATAASGARHGRRQRGMQLHEKRNRDQFRYRTDGFTVRTHLDHAVNGPDGAAPR
ncbi:tRNA-specific 2-thiouridylase [Mycobacterium tuberculosis]|nr:tRNA-specific 2-thiouridylase [Mycobacterium tuberculosis]